MATKDKPLTVTADAANPLKKPYQLSTGEFATIADPKEVGALQLPDFRQPL